MKRKPFLIGILAAGLALTAALGTPEYCRIVSSVQSFQQYFRAMQTTVGSLGPIERFVYSLVLANSKPAHRQKRIARPEPRT
jgi:hypothetical protein